MKHQDHVPDTTPGTYLYDRILALRTQQEKQASLAAEWAAEVEADKRRLAREKQARAENVGWAARRAVICVDTGERFDSIASAAERIGRYRTSIANALTEGGRAAGLRWRYADREAVEPVPPILKARERMQSVPVVCRCTGHVYAGGVAEASAMMGLNRRGILEAIRRGTRCGGRKWAYKTEAA